MSLDFVLGLDDISSYVIRGQTESLRWSVNSLFRRKVEIGNFVAEKKKTELFLSAKNFKVFENIACVLHLSNVGCLENWQSWSVLSLKV